MSNLTLNSNMKKNETFDGKFSVLFTLKHIGPLWANSVSFSHIKRQKTGMKSIFTSSSQWKTSPSTPCMMLVSAPPTAQMNDGRYWMNPSICFTLVRRSQHFHSAPVLVSPHCTNQRDKCNQMHPALNRCIISCMSLKERGS